MAVVLEQRVSHESWAERTMNSWQGRALRGWANLMASRYGRPVYLTGGALKDTVPRDIDVRVVLSVKEFEVRFGAVKRRHSRYATDLDEMDHERCWHVEIAKMNKQGAGNTHLPIDFQVQFMAEAAGYLNEPRLRLDDLPDLRPPWED